MKWLNEPMLATFLQRFPESHHENRSKSCEHFARIIGDDLWELLKIPRT
jgi:hypothetical protein